MKTFMLVMCVVFYCFCALNIFWWQFGAESTNVIQFIAYELATLKWLAIAAIGHCVINLVDKEIK